MTEGVKEVRRKKRKVNNRFKLLIAVMTFAIQASGILFVNEIYGSPKNCILWVAVQIVLLVSMGLIVTMEVKAKQGKLKLELMKKKAEVYSKVLKHEFSLEEASKELEKIFGTKISAEDVDTLLRLDCPEEVDENGRVVGTVNHG